MAVLERSRSRKSRRASSIKDADVLRCGAAITTTASSPRRSQGHPRPQRRLPGADRPGPTARRDHHRLHRRAASRRVPHDRELRLARLRASPGRPASRPGPTRGSLVNVLQGALGAAEPDPLHPRPGQVAVLEGTAAAVRRELSPGHVRRATSISLRRTALQLRRRRQHRGCDAAEAEVLFDVNDATADADDRPPDRPVRQGDRQLRDRGVGPAYPPREVALARGPRSTAAATSRCPICSPACRAA